MSQPRPQIIVTRPEPMGEWLSRELEQLGYQTHFCPLITFSPAENLDKQKLFQQLLAHNLWIFISRQAVSFCFDALKTPELNQLSQQQPPIYAVGQATQQALLDYGFTAQVPDRYDSEGILDLISLHSGNKPLQPLLIRGNKGRELLEETLSKQYPLSILEVYQRQATKTPLVLPDAANTAYTNTAHTNTAYIVTSGQLLQLTHQQLTEAKHTHPLDLSTITIICASQRISDLARHIGFTSCYTAQSAANSDLIQACLNWRNPLLTRDTL